MNRKKWFTYAAAIALIGAATLTMYGCVKGYSESRDGKISWSDTEPAAVLAAAGTSKPASDGGKGDREAPEKTGADPASSVKKEDVQADRYDRNWLGHPAEDFIMPGDVKVLFNEEKSDVKKRREDMSEQEAAEIGLRWLYAVYGYDPSGQTVVLGLVESVPNKRYWSGYVGSDDTHDAYNFIVDSVSGKLIMLSAPQRYLYRNRDQDEKLFSIRDMTYLCDNLYWSKIIRRFLEQTGLPMGKTVNTVKVGDVREGMVGLTCIYNEISKDTEIVNIGYDFVTNEVVSYYNKTAMEEKQK